MKKLLRNQKGFTLIELLIVIAVLGVLAAVVLAAIDPLEQLARGRDSGRKSSVAQIGHALEAYSTVNNNVYPTVNVTWMTTLTGTGDLKIAPVGTNGAAFVAPTCSGGGLQNGFCYKYDTTNSIVVVYTNMESRNERNKGACGGVAASTWYAYSSANGRAGLVCGSEPGAAQLTFVSGT